MLKTNLGDQLSRQEIPITCGKGCEKAQGAGNTEEGASSPRGAMGLPRGSGVQAEPCRSSRIWPDEEVGVAEEGASTRGEWKSKRTVRSLGG